MSLVSFLGKFGGPISSGIQAIGGFLTGQGNLKKQHKYNMQLARYQMEANQAYLDKQLEYNTPANQMARFKEAGLNPHLVYGQGNPGNQSAPLSAPDIRPVDFVSNNLTQQAFQSFNQSMLMRAQTSAVNANTEKATVQASLYKMQEQVLSKNPLLDPVGFKAIIDGLVNTAQNKALDNNFTRQRLNWTLGYKDDSLTSNGFRMMDAQLKLLEQKYKLAEADQKVRSEIIKSKEFQNDILEVQKNFMTNADVTPQHIYQFIQMLLMKML